MAASQRRRSVVVDVGGVRMGGDYPIRVQSMTNTPTADVAATVAQIRALAEAGSELVRITVNTEEAARAVPRIVETVRELGLTTPVIGDFHYNGHLLLTQYPECARALDKYRINPGNVGSSHHDENFAAFIRAAVTHGKPIRIGVNWGSLDQQVLAEMMDRNAQSQRPVDAQTVLREAMVESALRSAELAEKLGQPHDRIVLSVKMSRVADMVAVYRQLAARCDYPLHLGLTEAGMGVPAIVASAAALAILLEEGIGDTIRVSITPEPGGDRTREVEVARAVLQALELRRFVPRVFSCPGCGRTTNTFFQELAGEVQAFLVRRMPEWRELYPGVEEMQVAVMGCVVNGPGESKHADIGISLPGTFEEPKAPVYIDGKLVTTLRGEGIADEFKRIIEEYVAARFSRNG